MRDAMEHQNQYQSGRRYASAPGPGNFSFLPIPADNRILFYMRDRETFGFLSNFSPTPILLDRALWPTVEHFYQAQKSFDPDYRRTILGATRPGIAKNLGADPTLPRRRSNRSWFRRHGRELRPDWEEAKIEIMRRANAAKFAQHPALGAALCVTGNAELIEDSPVDAFWGTGPDGDGLNWAGRILSEIRDRLRG
jgi:ribA/ribD-fused uncharacterized protein